LSGFLPDEFVSIGGSPAPDPWAPPSPYNDVIYGPFDLGIEQAGFLKRGTIFGHSLDVLPSGSATWWGMFAQEWIFMDTNWSGYITGNGIAWVPDLTFDGAPESGFDGRSNPKWQMVPAGSSRQVKVHAPPVTTATPAEMGIGRPIIKIGDMPNPPVQCSPLTTGTQITVTHSGPVDSYLLKEHTIGPNPPNTAPYDPSSFFPHDNWLLGQDFENVRGTLGVDVRTQPTVSVAVYPVYHRRRWPNDPPEGTLLPPNIELPTEEALRTELRRIYRDGANVEFTVAIAPEVLEWETDEDLDGDGRCSMNTDEDADFRFKARDNAYRVSIFVFDVGRWSIGYGLGSLDPVEMEIGANTNRIGGIYVFTDQRSGDVESLAHEVGHCLGLFHPFETNPDTPTNGYNVPDFSSTRIMGYNRTGQDRLIKSERDEIHLGIAKPSQP
jgi:hypothetical protein